MSENLRNYVMVQRDSLYWLVGPFPTERGAAEWGRLAYPPDADPRWQTIALADPRSIPTVISPSEVPRVALSPAAVYFGALAEILNVIYLPDQRAQRFLGYADTTRVALIAERAMAHQPDSVATDPDGGPSPEERMAKRAIRELARARAKFPKQDVWISLAALTEEVGELNKEILQIHFEPDKGATWEKAYKEALQVIAMAMRIILDCAPSEPLTVEPRS